MNKTAKHLAAAGRGGDTRIAHLTPGEVVVPRKIAPLALGLLSDAGIDPERYQVGRNANSRNPRTGLLEFRHDDGSDNSDSGDDGAGGDQGGGDMGGADQREASRRERAGMGEGGWDANGSRDDGKYGRPDGSYGEKDRVASFGAFGTTDYGSGILRARTPAELASYGISPQDMNSLRTAGWGVIAPGASMPSMQRNLSLAGLFSPMPGGSQFGSLAGTAIDRNTLRTGLQGLGYDARYSDAMAAGRTTPDAISSMASPVVGGLFGPYGGLLNKLAGGRLASKAADMAFDQTLAGASGAKPQGPRTSSDKQGIGGLLDDGPPRPMGQMQPQAVASAYQYAPGDVMAMPWNPIQWGNQYDPLMRG